MTATPIPRTLALSYFADFDVSTIDSLPPGRQPIKTRWVTGQQANKAYDFVRGQVELGRQAYVVLPQIDDTGLDNSKSVTKEFKRLGEGPLAGLKLAMLHGRMTTEEKHATMTAFRDGTVDVLIATTVIEVGIDVPNATVMLIEAAERYGLSQLHQLRGRIGRGEHESLCVLFGDPRLPRLEAIASERDGFKLAEVDLELRGEGQILGTRQHGLPVFKVARIPEDLALLELARDRADELLERDPDLREPEHALLRAAAASAFGPELEPIPA